MRPVEIRLSTGSGGIDTTHPISGWEDFLADGEGYLQTAAGAHAGKKTAFTPEILYNLVSMAIEKFIMAALMRHGALPWNHTMRDLAEALEAAFPDVKNTSLGKRLIALDRYQEICDTDHFTIRPPDESDIPSMIELAREIRQLVSQVVPATA